MQAKNETSCTGWWHQPGLGRQPMDELRLSIREGTITGAGSDIIAPFTLTGHIRENGVVEMIKRYLGRHSVLYVGTYDGEGTLYGTWDIGGYRGDWLIRFGRPIGKSSEAIEDMEIEELSPVQT